MTQVMKKPTIIVTSKQIQRHIFRNGWGDAESANSYKSKSGTGLSKNNMQFAGGGVHRTSLALSRIFYFIFHTHD